MLSAMPAVRRSALAAALVPLVLVGASACTQDAPRTPSSAPSAPASVSSTPLASLDTTSLVVARTSFCDAVSPAAAEDALGAEVESSSSYRNGQKTRLAPKVSDVAHEFGCVWTTTDGDTARAWVFAPPVTRARARQLTRASATKGCSTIRDAAFGAPSVATRCGGKQNVTESYFGLFGDAWLSCTLEVAKPRPADLTERADRWCAAIAQAASS